MQIVQLGQDDIVFTKIAVRVSIYKTENKTDNQERTITRWRFNKINENSMKMTHMIYILHATEYTPSSDYDETFWAEENDLHGSYYILEKCN